MKKLTLFFAFFLALVSQSFATNWYCKAAFSGTNTGTSWTNAWGPTNIVWGSVLAGDTIWCAGGTYSTLWAIPNNKAGTSSSPISIRRVIASDPIVGSAATDWNPAYDSNIVTTSNLAFPQIFSWFTIDGRTKAGISINGSTSGSRSIYVAGTVTINGLTLKWIQVKGAYTSTSVVTEDNGIDLAPQNGSITNLLISHCRVVGKCEAIRSALWNTAIIEYCYVADTRTETPNANLGHADLGYIYGNTQNLTWRYNIFNNSPADGIFHEFGGAVNEWFIGNIFYNCQAQQINFKGPGTYGPFHIVNNTFYSSHNGTGSGVIGWGSDVATWAAGSTIQNNIFYNVGNQFSGTVPSDHNVYNPVAVNGFNNPTGETGSIVNTTTAANIWTTVPATVEGDGGGVIGTEVADFHLKNSGIANTYANGATLASDGFLNKDPDGQTRTAGSWSSGTYQFLSGAAATVYYIDPVNGSDTNDGLSTSSKLKTINRFSAIIGSTAGAGAGITAICYPGLYPSIGGMFVTGVTGNPVVIKSTARPTLANCTNASQVAIITGADNGAASPLTGFLGKIPVWTNTNVNSIYSAPCTWLPQRVTVNNTIAGGPFDVYPYATLSELQNLRVSSASVQAGVYPAGYTSGTNGNGVPYPTFIPGPHGGFFADGTNIYVRLDPIYCTNVNPGDSSNRMMVGGTSSVFNWSFSGTTGRVKVDGFAIEGGTNGITVKGPECVIQNCVFTGNYTSIDALTAANLTIQNCEFSAHPCFNDAKAAVVDYMANPSLYQDPSKDTAPWSNYGIGWAHKLPTQTNYERAFIRNLGADNIVTKNFFHDGEDGLGAFATSVSVRLQATFNFIARMGDNAIEFENSGNATNFSYNICKDCFEPISWQPNGPPPFPTATSMTHNVIYDTPGNLSYWQNITNALALGRCQFKILLPTSIGYPGGAGTVPANIPTGGWLIQNNTIWALWGELVHWAMPFNGSVNSSFGPVCWINNLIVDQYPVEKNYRELASSPSTLNWSNMTFINNTVAAPLLWGSGPGTTVAGPGGFLYPDVTKLKITDPTSTFNFVPLPTSFLIGRGAPAIPQPLNATVPTPISLSTTVGAYNVGDTPLPASAYGVQTGAL